MNQSILIIIAALLSLAACTKREAEAEKSESKGTHDENIVTVTKQNLQSVEIKAEPAALGSLNVTLKAAGRVSENMNKTAKVTSTLEGRITKLNVDINDHVKEGDVVALIQTPELVGKALELKAPIDGVIVERNSAVGELVERANAIYTISDPTDLWVLAEIKEVDIGAVKVGQDARFTVLAFPGEIFHGKVGSR
jgi:multidrug efflux pump subunit AcrA (membrane-fusion protein)